MAAFTLKILLLTSLCFSIDAEDFKFEMKGVKVSLISELSKVSPGEKFTVAFYIQHFDDYHTYWKNPGLVGFATSIEWALPKDFKAGPVKWQVPERSKMLKYNCHAYKGDAYLLVDIQAPKDIPKDFKLKAKVGGMSCSTKECCKIGFLDVELPLQRTTQSAVNEASKKKIDLAKLRLPEESDKVKIDATRDGEWLTLKISGKLPKFKDLYFYSYKNITDTEAEQNLEIREGVSYLKVKLNKYAPEKIVSVGGLLYNESGWNSEKLKYIRFEKKLN